MRILRYLYRAPWLLLHLLLAIPLSFIVLAPRLGGRALRSGERLDHGLMRWWSGRLVRVFGFRLSRRGVPLPAGVLLVANHISWMDIEIIHSQRMACFVAKAEIARWPLVGWLSTLAGTIFHQRGSTSSLASVSQTMTERLRHNLAVAVFPEGGTGPGDEVRTFHARIFQAAVDAPAPIQPVALRFSRNDALTTEAAFRPGESFFANFVRLLGSERLDIEVIFLEPICDYTQGRRYLAEVCRQRIIQALGLSDLDHLADSTTLDSASTVHQSAQN
jgi:1-acyl-sn-glycerol-3-phosphate acyltransferase